MCQESIESSDQEKLKYLPESDFKVDYVGLYEGLFLHCARVGHPLSNNTVAAHKHY